MIIPKPPENKDRAFSSTRASLSWKKRLSGYLSSDKDNIHPAQLRRTLSILVFIRMLILVVLLGASAWSFPEESSGSAQLGGVIWTITIILLISLANFFCLKIAKRLIVFGYGQFGLDILLVTLAIFVTGGMSSPFVFMYLLVILAAAAVFSLRGALVISACCGLSYAMLASGLLPTTAGIETSASTFRLLAVYTSLVGCAWVSVYFAKQLETVRNVAQAQALNLSELSYHQQQLFDDISEGIITLDLEDMVTNINKAACAILGLNTTEGDQLLGKSLPDLLEGHGVSSSSTLLKRSLNTGSPEELSFSTSEGSKELSVNFTARHLKNSGGNNVGKIVFFYDVSHIRNIEKRLSMHEHMTKLLAADMEPTSVSVSSSEKQQMIGESQVMKQVFSLIERVAASDASVLISGESGTGKELIAKAIHRNSSYGSRPFVAINCGAIPENLIESELFGYKRGSFTGANSDKPGLFRQANGGSIFLDEIGDLPLQLQTKLLRVLQERTIRPVGDVHDYPVNVRVISATNRDLKQNIAEGTFREDLYYRLNVVNIVVPPLRERKEDIPHLVRYFISRYAAPNQPMSQVSPEALDLLMSYSFPGNIRELENIVERAIVLGGSAILPEFLPPEVHLQPSHDVKLLGKTNGGGLPWKTEVLTLPVDLEEQLAQIEMELLTKALDKSGGVKKQAAKLLGLNFRSFRYRLKKYGLGETSLD